jgi:hypothetical protein
MCGRGALLDYALLFCYTLLVLHIAAIARDAYTKLEKSADLHGDLLGQARLAAYSAISWITHTMDAFCTNHSAARK